jgi:hypothetical protein
MSNVAQVSVHALTAAARVQSTCTAAAADCCRLYMAIVLLQVPAAKEQAADI